MGVAGASLILAAAIGAAPAPPAPGLILATAASDAPMSNRTSAPPAVPLAGAAAPAPPLGSAVASSAATPLNETVCDPPTNNCRHLADFGLTIGAGQTVTVKTDKDMAYISPDGGLLLAAGESVTLSITGEGALAELALVSAGPADSERLAPLVLAATGQTPPTGAVQLSPPPGQIRISLLQRTGAPDMVLLVENGLTTPITYGASRISVANVQAPTTVCPVAAGKIGVERWPEAFPFIQLAGFAPAAANLVCR